MDIEQLYKDHNIDYVTGSDQHRHSRPGWINTPCPFCVGNPGYHLGYDIQDDKFVCWRCGGHSVFNSVMNLLNLSVPETKKILKHYGVMIVRDYKMKRKIRTKAFKFPSNVTKLQTNHLKYLVNRGFDPEYLVKEWDLRGTGVVSKLDDISYKHRIIIPFYWDDEIVTFDSRDITDKAMNKYQACPIEREFIHRKDILFGKQDEWTDTGICVEGPFDVFRMGFNSFACSGIKYTPKQLKLIAKTFKRVPVLFDDDPQAIKQANKLVADLKFRGVDSFRVDITGDPGSLSDKEAKYLLKQLI